MTGQMTLFEYMDAQQGYSMCTSCVNAKFKERMRNGHDVYFCNKKRAVITEHTGSWLCKNLEYERRIP